MLRLKGAWVCEWGKAYIHHHRVHDLRDASRYETLPVVFTLGRVCHTYVFGMLKVWIYGFTSLKGLRLAVNGSGRVSAHR